MTKNNPNSSMPAWTRKELLLEAHVVKGLQAAEDQLFANYSEHVSLLSFITVIDGYACIIFTHHYCCDSKSRTRVR